MGEIRGQVRAGRWQLIGDQCVCLHNGVVEDRGHWWAAVFQGGPHACPDGASALIASGLERFDVDRVRVSVPRRARIRRTWRCDIRQTPSVTRCGRTRWHWTATPSCASPLLGLRLCPDDFLAQIERALVAGGMPAAARTPSYVIRPEQALALPA
jgi:hypothetical protein